jgi:hypothetical protein
MDDLPLFQAHSATSRAAAESIAPGAGTLRGIVLEWLRENGPATDETMQEELCMGPSTQRPRRVELVRAGFVRDSGRTAVTRSGRQATLWEVST